MDARRIIARLRDAETPSAAELRWFANGLATGEVTDAQAGAFAMAACLNGLGEVGRVALTEAMRDSGEVLGWDLPGPVLDKHSTGGVGDCVSILLAPALAACGAFVPMISGRGLGHTGGTLDKLEAIPGVATDLGLGAMREVVAEVGCAIVGASDRIAPADRRLYAIRDESSTVESIDLITASILSKKLAAGLNGLVLDVKVGAGAFMKTPEDARGLMRVLCKTASGAGCPTAAIMSDMSQPLANAAGNALEVACCMEVLDGSSQGTPLEELTVALGAELLVIGGLASHRVDGAEQITASLADGSAKAKLGQMIAAMGGPADFAARWRDYLPKSQVVVEVPSPRLGYVTGIDTQALGEAAVSLGAGRFAPGAEIDPSVGLSDIVRIGERVEQGAPLARVHASSAEDAARCREVVARAFLFDEDAPPPSTLVMERAAT